MQERRSSRKVLIAAERRRKIYAAALERGSVNVTDMAATLGVNPDTVRRDLNELQKEGKLVRSHGGATARESEVAQQPYSKLRNENLKQKSWIGQAAISYLPDMGSIFIGAGSTTYQMALSMPENWQGQIITGSPEIALHMAWTVGAPVGLLGGNIRKDSYSSDCSWSEHILDMANWDVTFLSASAVDIEHGISAIDINAALMERRIIEHGKKLVLLCDSSKFRRFSRARVGPIDLVHTLVTDEGVSPEMVRQLTDLGVEVFVAGPIGSEVSQGGQLLQFDQMSGTTYSSR